MQTEMTLEWEGYSASNYDLCSEWGASLEHRIERLVGTEKWSPPELGRLRDDPILGIWTHSPESAKRNWIVVTETRIENLTWFGVDKDFGRDTWEVRGWASLDRGRLSIARVMTCLQPQSRQPGHEGDRYRAVAVVVENGRDALMTENIGYYEEGGFLQEDWPLRDFKGMGSHHVRLRPESQVIYEAAGLTGWLNGWFSH